MKLLIDFLPVVIFFLVYKMAPELIELLSGVLSPENIAALNATQPIILATAVLIPATVLQILYTRYKTGKVERMHLVTLVLVVLLGGTTVILQDKEFIMWKPTIVNWLFAGAFLFSQWFMENPFLQLMMEQAVSMPAESWAKLNYAWVGFFVMSGLANLYVAYNFSEDA
ncbi:MAG: inner membrane-spanning protein YciB, partial [Venatoribacter sp.]